MKEIKLGNLTKNQFIKIGTIKLLKDSYWGKELLDSTMKKLAEGLFEAEDIKKNNIKVLKNINLKIGWDLTHGGAKRKVTASSFQYDLSEENTPYYNIYCTQNIEELKNGNSIFIDELRFYLDLLENSNIEYRPYLTDFDFLENLDKDNKFIIDKITDLAYDLVITEDLPDYYNIESLSNKGIKIERGEYDSFGWLSCVLVTKKGRIVFG